MHHVRFSAPKTELYKSHQLQGMKVSKFGKIQQELVVADVTVVFCARKN